MAEWNHMPELDWRCVPRDWVADLSLAGHGGPETEAGQLWISWPRPGPHRLKTIGREKSEAQPPSSCSIQEDQQNSLNRFKVSRKFFFFFHSSVFFSLFFLPLSETIRRGVVKCPDTNPKGEHKANTKNWEHETNVTLLSYRAGILLFVLLFFHYFTTFILLEFFFISLPYV